MRNGLRSLPLLSFIFTLALFPAAPSASQDAGVGEQTGPVIPPIDDGGNESSDVNEPADKPVGSSSEVGAPNHGINNIAEQQPFGFCAPPCFDNPFD